MIYSPLAPGRLVDPVELLRRQYPSRRVAAVSPSDSQDLPFYPSVIYAISGGLAALRFEDGSQAVLPLVEGPNPVPAAVVRILATGTTAQVAAIAG